MCRTTPAEELTTYIAPAEIAHGTQTNGDFRTLVPYSERYDKYLGVVWELVNILEEAMGEVNNMSQNIVQTCTTNERNMLSRFDSIYSYLETHVQRTDHLFRTWSQDFLTLNEKYNMLISSALPQNFAGLMEHISSNNLQVSEYRSKVYKDFCEFAVRTQKNIQNIEEKFSRVQTSRSEAIHSILELQHILFAFPEAYVSREPYSQHWEYT